MTDKGKGYIRQKNAGQLPWEIEPDPRNQEEHPFFGGSSTEDQKKKFPNSRLVTPSRRQIAAMVLQGIVSSESGWTREQQVKEAVLLTDLLLKELG